MPVMGRVAAEGKKLNPQVKALVDATPKGICPLRKVPYPDSRKSVQRMIVLLLVAEVSGVFALGIDTASVPYFMWIGAFVIIGLKWSSDIHRGVWRRWEARHPVTREMAARASAEAFDAWVEAQRRNARWN